MHTFGMITNQRVLPPIILSILSKHLPATPLPHLRFHKQKFKICFCLFIHRFRLLSRYLAEMCRLSVKIITSSGDSPPQFPCATDARPSRRCFKRKQRGKESRKEKVRCFHVQVIACPAVGRASRRSPPEAEPSTPRRRLRPSHCGRALRYQALRRPIRRD